MLAKLNQNSFSGGRIFLLFDPTHIVKNIYNNFLTKKVFKMPMLSPILSQNLTAKFSDVKNVYDLERHKPLRIVYFFFYLFSFLLTINLKLIIVHVEIKIVNKEAATKRSTLLPLNKAMCC